MSDSLWRHLYLVSATLELEVTSGPQILGLVVISLVSLRLMDVIGADALSHL